MLLLQQNKRTVVVRSVVHRLEQFQPVYHTVHTSPTNSSNQYTTPSTHHLQRVPTGIPHLSQITYKELEPVCHTVHTSPTNSSNQYTTPSTNHLQTVRASMSHRPHVTYKQFQPVYHTATHICTLYLSMTSPWRWQQYRPKHIGENFVDEIHHKIWSAFLVILY